MRIRTAVVVGALTLTIAPVLCATPVDEVARADIHPSLIARLDEADGPVKAWVRFADKGVAPGAPMNAALEAVAAGYDRKAVQRRMMRRTAPGLFDERDLPVAPAYVEAVAATGARVHVESRWLNAVSVRLTPAQMTAISRLPFVTSLEPVRRGRRIDPVVAERPAAPTAPLGFYGLSEEQIVQIGLDQLHAAGATGSGVVIGILDTGFRRDHEAFNHPDHTLLVVAEHDFINDDGNTGIDDGDPENQHNHGTLILGTIGAYMPGTLVGAAYDASFILCKTEDITDEYQGEEDNYVGGLEFIEMNGGDVATSSLGYIDWYTQADLDGLTAVTTIAVNVATANGLHCCTAAGNSGHDDDPATSHLLAPSDAFQVIACGAVNIEGEIAGFSADGPSADGRVKPEVLARGVGTWTVSSSANDGYRDASGTSLSTPLVASAVACMVQAQPGWTVDQLRDLLFRTADYFGSSGGFDPLFIHGYGIIDAFAAVSADCNGNGIHDADDISGGSSDDVNGNGIPDECECLADVDGDGAVGFTDLVTLLAGWGPCPPPCAADLNGDGNVGFTDLLTMLSLWGPC